MDDKNNKYYVGSVSDRIGSEGIISVLGFTFKEKKLVVENFILSCRVFGRYIEESMLLPLFEHAIKVESDIYFEYINTSRNIVIKKFLKNLTSNKNYIPLKKVKDLHHKFSQLPINIINNN